MLSMRIQREQTWSPSSRSFQASRRDNSMVFIQGIVAIHDSSTFRKMWEMPRTQIRGRGQRKLLEEVIH